MQEATAQAKEPEPVMRLAIEVDRFEFEFTEKQAEDIIARLTAGLKVLKAKSATSAGA